MLSCCILPTTLPRMDGGYKVMQDECFEHPLMACSPQSLTFDIISSTQLMIHHSICHIPGVVDAHNSLSDFGFGS